MPATIFCTQEVKDELSAILSQKLGALMDSIQEDEESILIEETADGLNVDYPTGEIYGYTSDYVQALPHVFRQLKKSYPAIGVEGLVYEYETITCATFGAYFHCAPEDKTLTIDLDNWQECATCGNVVEGDTFYNSSQRDFGEGNLLCLCCPTCMLEYALDTGWGELEPNASIADSDQDALYSSDDEDEALKSILWQRITKNTTQYLFDFNRNRSRVVALAESAPADKREVLHKLLKRLR